MIFPVPCGFVAKNIKILAIDRFQLNDGEVKGSEQKSKVLTSQINQIDSHFGGALRRLYSSVLLIFDSYSFLHINKINKSLKFGTDYTISSTTHGNDGEMTVIGDSYFPHSTQNKQQEWRIQNQNAAKKAPSSSILVGEKAKDKGKSASVYHQQQKKPKSNQLKGAQDTSNQWKHVLRFTKGIDVFGATLVDYRYRLVMFI